MHRYFCNFFNKKLGQYKYVEFKKIRHCMKNVWGLNFLGVLGGPWGFEKFDIPMGWRFYEETYVDV